MDTGYEASYNAYIISDAVFTTGTLTEDFTEYDELGPPEITNAATTHPLRGAFRRRKRGCGSIQPGKALSTVGGWSSLYLTTDNPTLSTTHRACPRSRSRSTQDMVRFPSSVRSLVWAYFTNCKSKGMPRESTRLARVDKDVKRKGVP
ncbi:hypothetical protein BDV98DRAFT_587273 [Pterulicium gracile]|uniref:Uncharacterized protein n=1 Tax=Pterulicium gracile TaxID=1884261 RepID=A0A5C3Q9R3_9AGAR|nr:hypothetical protein BDV98DRAFT_587273 [Pterula gracilis]